MRAPPFNPLVVPQDAEDKMSVTTTQKNTNFQSTPLQDVEKLTDVPGVGAKSAEKLLEANIDSPIKLMGNFMVRVCVHAQLPLRIISLVHAMQAARSPTVLGCFSD